MKILITGGTGTLSSGIVEECLKKGFNVTTLNRGSNKYRNVKGARNIYVDIADKQAVINALNNEEFDVVIECLAYRKEQVLSSVEMFSQRCKQYIFISTAAVYDRDNIAVTEESSTDRCEWSYAINKLECEECIKKYYKRISGSNKFFTIIRPIVTYGAYRVPFPVATRTPAWTLFDRILSQKPILASTNIISSAIYIDDFSRAVVRLFDNKKAINEIFHIGNENCRIQWDDVIKISSHILGITPTIVHVPVDMYRFINKDLYDELRFDKTKSLVVNGDKLSNAIDGFEIEVPINEGIKKILAKMKEEFEENKLVVDEKWNDFCDKTIRYAYRKNALTEKEIKKLDSYYKMKKKKELIKLDFEIDREIMRNIARSFYHTLRRN